MPPSNLAPADPKNRDPERDCEPTDIVVHDVNTNVAQGSTTSTTKLETVTRTAHGCNPTASPSQSATTTSACVLPTLSARKATLRGRSADGLEAPPSPDPCALSSWAVFPKDALDMTNKQRLQTHLSKFGAEAQITYISTSQAPGSDNLGDNFFFVQYLTEAQADEIENGVSPFPPPLNWPLAICHLCLSCVMT
jgi:hypothetical protein